MKKSQSSEYFNSLIKSLGVDKEGILTVRPTAEYRFATGKLTNYGSFEGHEGILILGLEDDEGNYNCIGLGDFSHENQQVSSFAITGFDFNNDALSYFTLNNDGTIDAQWYAIAGNIQNSLYTHTITLTAGTNNYVLMYDCSNETPVDSIRDLRIIMGITSTSDKVILPVVNLADLSTAGLEVTTSICKIGTANITTFSDKVTPKR